MAQTTPRARRPGARALRKPVRALLGGEDLTGRFYISLSIE